MAVQDVAVEHYQERRSIIGAVVQAVALWWAYLDRRDLDGSWADVVLPGLLGVLTTGQRAAAEGADRYASRLSLEWEVPDTPAALVVPDAFSGVAADQRSLEGLLTQPFIHTKVLLAAGSPMEEALGAGLVRTQRAVKTETQDAGRMADGVAIVTRPQYVGYYRHLQVPSCDRCVVLAGRWYKWSDGFLRHENCDCQHVPAPGVDAGEVQIDRLLTDPLAAVRAGQITGLSQAERHAVLEEGADLGRIVNAKRKGLSTAGSRRGGRPSVEAIYRRAGGSREEAVRLLERSGYIDTTSA